MTAHVFATDAGASVFDAVERAALASLSMDEPSRLLYQLWGDGQISDGDAALIEARISAVRPPSPGRERRDRSRVLSRLRPRRVPRSLDRQASRDRRRMLGGSGGLPANLRHHYTEGQRAVLAIIAGECKHHGICDLPIDKIAALAGVCRTTVQNALHEARRLGHLSIIERPRRGQKSLTNLVGIVSPEWKSWLKRGSTAHRPIGSKTVKTVSPTKSTGFNLSGLNSCFSRGNGSAWALEAGRRRGNAPGGGAAVADVS